MIRIRGLFFILIMVLVSLLVPLDEKFRSLMVIIAVVTGWGVEYLMDYITDLIKNKNSTKGLRGKLLDSSAIIDGRIIDILESKFLEGKLIVPRFILRELQALSDSQDGMKRAKGRRGLDLVKSMQDELKNSIEIVEDDYEIKEVDSKLVKLAKDKNYDLITTDFNLNKVATIQGVNVLNINKLTNALKPRVFPNEELNIELIKKGDRDGQAVGYLNDGTMVVAEDGGDAIGKKITLTVTSVYPTVAGRMIFGRIRK